MRDDEVKMPIPVKVDDNGIVDGLALAQHLILEAHKLIVFYTRGCKGCTGAVIGAMFDLAMETQPCEKNHFTENAVVVLNAETIPPEMIDAAIRDHLLRLRPSLLGYLKEAGIRGAATHHHPGPVGHA